MSEKQEDFFSKAERSIIVHELLMRTKYDEENDKFGMPAIENEHINDNYFHHTVLISDVREFLHFIIFRSGSFDTPFSI